MWQVSFCFQQIPWKRISQKCGLRFSLAITVFKISGFKVFKCYVIFQKSLNLIRLQPKTIQLCRPVPEMNPEKMSRIYEEMKAKPKDIGFSFYILYKFGILVFPLFETSTLIWIYLLINYLMIWYLTKIHHLVQSHIRVILVIILNFLFSVTFLFFVRFWWNLRYCFE